MEPLCLTDRQWPLIESLRLGKKSDPGRSGSGNRVFIKGVFFRGFSRLCRAIPIWNTLWWMPPLSRFTGTATAQKPVLGAFEAGDSHSGPFGWLANQPLRAGDGSSKGGWPTMILALTDALGNSVRAVPAMLGNPDPVALLRDLADELAAYGEALSLKERVERVAATMAMSKGCSDGNRSCWHQCVPAQAGAHW